MRLLKGDCREQLKLLPDEAVDSIVTDPPYELGFMGKSWDASGIAYNVEVWRECLRVLKPGGHLLAFGGSRTYHRLACAVEDAGFDIRDQIMWVYGSGFPKSLDVGKAIDKQRYDREQLLSVTNWIADAVAKSPRTHRDILQAFGFNEGSGMVGHWTARTAGSQPSIPTLEKVPTLLDTLGLTLDDVPDDIKELLWTLNTPKGQPSDDWFKREIIGQKTSGIANKEETDRHTIGASKAVVVDVTATATDDAKKWDGWGTALKPAHEPVVVARKPLAGTVAQNVLRYGTGAINIDGCRVEGEPWKEVLPNTGGRSGGVMGQPSQHPGGKPHDLGRWPANFIHDGSDEVLELFPETKPETSAARFFYCAKASKAERNAGVYLCECSKLRAWDNEGQKAQHQTDTEQSAQKATDVFGTQNNSDTEWNTSSNGNAITGQSHKDTKSTTSTVTNLTTESPTLNASIAQHTNGFIQDANKETGHGGNLATSVNNSKKSQRKTGTYPEKDGPSTEDADPATLQSSSKQNSEEGLICKTCNGIRGGHPTVKPIDLMRYLIRLVTPPNGTVLDPFAGSGTTLVAAIHEHMNPIGIELTEEYWPIIEARTDHARNKT